MKDLGNRIRTAIYKVEELQEELNKRLQVLERTEYAHTCVYYTPTACMSCTLHNTPCRDQACMDYWKGVEDKCSKCTHRCNEDYGLEPIEVDYRETAEDTGTVKYTAEGLYDYGYEPIDDDIPF